VTSLAHAEPAFSPVDNELPLRWFRRLRLVPPGGLGTKRRALIFAALTWVPIVVWAAMAGRLWDPDTGESLMRHYGIHVRCLIAIPLFILAEGALHRTVRHIVSHFLSSGVVALPQKAAFEGLVADARRLRDSSLPWVFVAGVTIAWTTIDAPSSHEDALSWAFGADGTLGFGGAWFVYVARPIFLALLLGWIWRILLVAYAFWRVGRLELSLVPSHPDHAGGIAFVEKLPGAYALVTFAMSAAIASRWAHEIAYHGATLQSYRLPAALFAILWTLLALLPLLALAPPLWSARHGALPEYAKLVGEQGRLVHRRWILGKTVGEEPILDAPEIGPVADAAAIYDAVKGMRTVPIGRSSLIRVLIPMALPMIVIAAMQVPIGELLLKLAKAVV
jgi:hypothetical protein